MKTLEKAACEFCNKSFQCSKPEMDKGYYKSCKSGIKRCFLAGANFRQPEIDDLKTEIQWLKSEIELLKSKGKELES